MLRSLASSARVAAPRRLAHTISTPTLVNLDRRWETMSPDEQADLQSQLAKRQEGPWSELTPEEKKAAYFVAFGEHGPRANVHPAGFQYKVAAGVFAGLAAASVMFYGMRMLGNPPPKTMTRVRYDSKIDPVAPSLSDLCPLSRESVERHGRPGRIHRPNVFQLC